MKTLAAVLFAALVANTWAALVLEGRATPRIFLTGDSTMARGRGGTGVNGWGQWIQYSLKIQVINDATAGRSARSYTVEGRFANVTKQVVAGDYVLIEFGHNDGGSPISTDNGSSDCPGDAAQVCTTSAGLVVQTFHTYITRVAELMLSKGAKVIISSQTPNNPCESGTCTYNPTEFVTYAKAVVMQLNNPNVVYVDHNWYTANRFIELGPKVVDTYFPHDHTHTSPEGVSVVAKAFMKGLICGSSSLKYYSKNSTASIEGVCY